MAVTDTGILYWWCAGPATNVGGNYHSIGLQGAAQLRYKFEWVNTKFKLNYFFCTCYIPDDGGSGGANTSWDFELYTYENGVKSNAIYFDGSSKLKVGNQWKYTNSNPNITLETNGVFAGKQNVIIHFYLKNGHVTYGGWDYSGYNYYADSFEAGGTATKVGTNTTDSTKYNVTGIRYNIAKVPNNTNVKIHNNTDWDENTKYIPYIHNGSDWEKYALYIHNGKDWE